MKKVVDRLAVAVYVAYMETAIPPQTLEASMTYAVQASNGKFYTGRAGEGWLGDEAFTYGKEGAEYKAALFNRNTLLHGLTFKAVEVK